jgi:hypothetical protein
MFSQRFEIGVPILSNVVDALFVGDHDRPGWVAMAVNASGRSCVDALFPDAHIAWRDADDLAPDWCGFDINLPDVVSATATKLPLEISGGADLDMANPDALAFLLAVGVYRQGGCSAILRNGRLEILHGVSH